MSMHLEIEYSHSLTRIYDLLHLCGFFRWRGMTSVTWSLGRVVYACLMAFTCAAVGDASAAIKKEKEATPVVFAAKRTPQQSEQEQTSPVQRANKRATPPATKRHPE